MPITNKKQLLSGTEVSEGVKRVFAPNADTNLIFDANLSDVVSRSDRVPASPSLGRRDDQIGRQSRRLTFKSDCVGDGDTGTAPFVAPPWHKWIRACGFRSQSLWRLPLNPIVGVNKTFQQGEKVYIVGSESDSYGICFNEPQAPGPHDLLVMWLREGTELQAPVPPGSGSLVGKDSGMAATISSAAVLDHTAYRPWSQKEQRLTLDAWTGGPVLAVGDVVRIERLGITVGVGQVIQDDSATSWDVLRLGMQWGEVQDQDIVYDAKINPPQNAALVNANPSQSRIPTLSAKFNIDGFARLMVGMRGSFTLDASAGEPGEFNWTFDGVMDDEIDEIAPGATGLGQLLPGRLLGNKGRIWDGTNYLQIPIRTFQFDPRNQVTMRQDAAHLGGDRAAEITDRDPLITIGTDLVGKGALDWYGLRDNGNPIRFAMRWIGPGQPGAANTIHVAAPHCQVIEVNDEDASGIAGLSVTLRPNFWDDGVIEEEGDNEFFIAQREFGASLP